MDIDEVAYNRIIEESRIDLSHRLELCDNYIYKDKFPNFMSFQREVQRYSVKKTCQFAFRSETLIFGCDDCSQALNSCICVDCFMKGNHNGHKIKYKYSYNGSCDCGDPLNWKPEGNCSDHPGPSKNPDLEDISSELRTRLITSFKAILSDFDIILPSLGPLLTQTVKWLKNYVSIADSVRRCFTIALSRHTDLKKFFFRLLETKNVDDFYSFFGGVSNDYVFSVEIAEVFIGILPEIYEHSLKLLIANSNNEQVVKGVKNFFAFSFHLTSSHEIKRLERNGFDWPKIYIKMVSLLSSAIDMIPNQTIKECRLSIILGQIESFYELSFKGDKWNSYTDTFIHKLSKIMQQKEISNMVFRAIGDKEDDTDQKALASHSLIYDWGNIIYTFANHNYPFDFAFPLLIESLSPVIDPMTIDISLLDPKAGISWMMSLHIMAHYYLEFSKPHPNTLVNLTNGTFGSIDYLSKALALYPLRLLIASRLYQSKFFIRNKESLLIVFSSLSFKANLYLTFLPLFNLIQQCFQMSQDKNGFATLIGKIFGIFDVNIDQTDKNNIEFLFIHFYLCLLLCNQTEKNTKKLFTDLIINHLKLKDLTSSQIESLIPNDLEKLDLSSITKNVEQQKSIFIQLTDDSDWNPFLPYLPQSLLFEVISKHSQKSSLLPIPEIDRHSNFLQEASHTQIIMAVVYQIIWNQNYQEGSSFKPSLDLCYSYLSFVSNFVSIKLLESNRVLHINSFFDLFSVMPADFSEYFQLQISYLGKEPASIYSMLIKLGGVTSLVLSKFGIYISTGESPNKKMDKTKSTEMKNKILKEFNNKQTIFSQTINGDIEVSIDECPICKTEQKDPILCYPAHFFKSAIPSTLWGVNPKSVVIFRSCCHHFHYECCGRTSQYKCPLDRSNRNCKLPVYQKDAQNTQYLTIVHLFLQECYGNSDFILHGAYSIAGEATIIEMRHRSNPSCFNDMSFSILIKNLFYILRSCNYSSTEGYFIEIPEVKLVRRLIQDPVIPFNDALKEYIPMESIERAFCYLRRAAILEHFIFDTLTTSRMPSMIDWDEILSISYLSQHYSVTVEPEPVLNPFCFNNLLPDFLDIIRTLWSQNKIYHGVQTAMCLITGEIVTMPNETKLPGVLSLVEHLTNSFDKCESVYMVVSGPKTLMVMTASLFFNQSVSHFSVYLDENGESNIGFNLYVRNMKLSHKNLEKLIEIYLSSKWIDNL